jgi:hypothetical protein
MTGDQQGHAVAALAGRRIDAPNGDRKQFPGKRIPTVRRALANIFEQEKVRILVSSAACGADLLALDIALHLGVECRVVLPFAVERFRATSVTDRPGDWGPLYDSVLARVTARGNLVVLDGAKDDDAAYRAVTRKIIEEALSIARPQLPIAVIVWEGEPRHAADATAEFQQLAMQAGMPARTVSTC